MGVISYIITGFIVGLLARAIKPGNDKMGWVMTTIIGIVGALIAGFIGRGLGWYAEGEPAGWIMSTIGGIIALFAYYALAGKRSAA